MPFSSSAYVGFFSSVILDYYGAGWGNRTLFLNKAKHNKCDLTIDQLLERIDIWNKKYAERRNGLEPLTSNLEG